MGRHRALAGEYPACVERTHSQLPRGGAGQGGCGVEGTRESPEVGQRDPALIAIHCKYVADLCKVLLTVSYVRYRCLRYCKVPGLAYSQESSRAGRRQREGEEILIGKAGGRR